MILREFFYRTKITLEIALTFIYFSYNLNYNQITIFYSNQIIMLNLKNVFFRFILL